MPNQQPEPSQKAPTKYSQELSAAKVLAARNMADEKRRLLQRQRELSEKMQKLKESSGSDKEIQQTQRRLEQCQQLLEKHGAAYELAENISRTLTPEQIKAAEKFATRQIPKAGFGDS